jgi:hypothetical protein
VAIALTQSVTGNGASLTLNGVSSGSGVLLTFQDSYFRNPSTGTAETIPTDTQGTWSVASSGVHGLAAVPSIDGGAGAGIFYQANAVAGTHVVTPQANTSHNATLCEWSGVDTGSPLDRSANAKTDSFAGTSQVTGTTAATVQQDELVLIALGLGASPGVSNAGLTDPVSGYTTQQKVVNTLSDVGAFHAYKIVSAISAQSATFNWTDTEANQYSAAAIATFKATAVSTLMGQAWT